MFLIILSSFFIEKDIALFFFTLRYIRKYIGGVTEETVELEELQKKLEDTEAKNRELREKLAKLDVNDGVEEWLFKSLMFNQTAFQNSSVLVPYYFFLIKFKVN